MQRIRFGECAVRRFHTLHWEFDSVYDIILGT